ncbi:hypothetical protein M5K25_007750 [Dendrobium thyrsiflorum]|uniref:FH2 domain-containing protein n=1 Tax=Dendrobium thyrsiflorum TaxID=117978 RepID=A0ABD0VF81_DENTH
MPELLDFYKDLIHLEAASKIQLKMVAEEMQAVSKGLEKVELELSASENDGKSPLVSASSFSVNFLKISPPTGFSFGASQRLSGIGPFGANNVVVILNSPYQVRVPTTSLIGNGFPSPPMYSSGALKSFLDTAEADVRSLISLYSEVGRSADSLAQYFGEDPARCPFEQGKLSDVVAIHVLSSFKFMLNLLIVTFKDDEEDEENEEKEPSRTRRIHCLRCRAALSTKEDLVAFNARVVEPGRSRYLQCYCRRAALSPSMLAEDLVALALSSRSFNYNEEACAETQARRNE